MYFRCIRYIATDVAIGAFAEDTDQSGSGGRRDFETVGVETVRNCPFSERKQRRG